MTYRLATPEAIDAMLRDASVVVSDADLCGTCSVSTEDIHAAAHSARIRLATAADGSGALAAFSPYGGRPGPDTPAIAVVPLPAPIARAIAAALMTAAGGPPPWTP
jgi:hypothetical protein